ncbi:MAG: hypothetical protein R2848_11650 [Thermomicrobiales bacterium]
MHPQHPWMMRLNAEEMQRDVERQMRIKQARSSAQRHSFGVVGSLRRALGLALIAAGGKIQPAPRPSRQYEAGMEVELAR